jgi:hypothetical protein
MRAKLLALAAALAALGSGVFFLTFSDAEQASLPESFGNLEIVDRSQCSISACNAAQCVQAANILSDAGSSCTLRFVECPFRVGARARAWFADGGVTLSASKYQQVKLVAMRCGSSLAIPVDDAGFPVYMAATGTPGCRKRDAGMPLASCSKLDGGDQGTDNQAPAAELTGAGCTSVPCGVIAGDEPP